MTTPNKHPRDYLIEIAFRGFPANAVFIAAELGIAECLVDGPKSTADLAVELSVDELSLFRLLRALAAMGIFEEVRPRVFSANDRSDPLRSAVDQSARDAIRVVGRLFQPACAKLLDSVRTGVPAFDLAFGAPFFEYLATNAEARDLFNSGMSSHSDVENRIIPEEFDFSVFQHVVDVGGGKGGLLAAILHRYPAATGTLFDLQTTIAAAEPLSALHSAGRCRLVAGNMFVDVPPGADCYVLKRVLHDWDDETSVKVLINCVRAMADGGKVLVIEGLVPEGNNPHPQKDGDLVMMSLLRGRERTLAEFDQVFGGAGLIVESVVPLSIGHSIVIGSRGG